LNAPLGALWIPSGPTAKASAGLQVEHIKRCGRQTRTTTRLRPDDSVTTLLSRPKWRW
jgi:hypothetical protein